MKRILSIVLVILLTFSLVACGSKNVPEEKFEALKKDYLQMKADYEELSQDYDSMLAEIDFFESEYDLLIVENENLRMELEEAKLDSGDTDSEPEDDSDPDMELPDPMVVDLGETKVNTEDIKILAEYSIVGGLYGEHLIIVKNVTDKTLDFSTEGIALDSNDKEIGTTSSWVSGLGPDATTIIWEVYELDKVGLEGYELIIETSPSEFTESVIQDLSYECIEFEGDGLECTVTNNSSKTAEFVDGYALFFKDGKFVDYDFDFFSDDNWELKAGESIKRELYSWEEFDSYEFYMTGAIYND